MTDEASPFNACAHAYLAATREALLRLAVLRPDDPAVTALGRRIDREMMAEGAALQLCQFSGQTFGTGTLIRPDWSALPGHWRSMAVLLLVVAAAGGGLCALVRPGGRCAESA